MMSEENVVPFYPEEGSLSLYVQCGQFATHIPKAVDRAGLPLSSQSLARFYCMRSKCCLATNYWVTNNAIKGTVGKKNSVCVGIYLSLVCQGCQ